MSHLTRDKDKLLARVRRIQGQVQAVSEERECAAILQLIAACRGAISGLMSEVVEHHIRHHVMDSEQHRKSEHSQAAEELIDVLRSYLK
jgi:DNA-binding FrmR family transcriptional regulator